MGASDWVYLDVRVVRRETEKAIQVVLDDGDIVWLPKSVLDEEYSPGERNLTVGIRDWFAEKEGF